MAHPVRGAHTFLFEPGVWTSTGTLWRADGEPLEAVGRTEIAHRRECWLLSGTLKVLGSPPTEFVHAYWIEPPGPKGASMKWSFENATFGTLKGTFAVIGESILSVYGCETSGYHGSDTSPRTTPTTTPPRACCRPRTRTTIPGSTRPS